MAFFWPGLLRMLAGLDPDHPFFLSDSYWSRWDHGAAAQARQRSQAFNGTRNSQPPKPEQPRCLPCTFNSSGAGLSSLHCLLLRRCPAGGFLACCSNQCSLCLNLPFFTSSLARDRPESSPRLQDVLVQRRSHGRRFQGASDGAQPVARLPGQPSGRCRHRRRLPLHTLQLSYPYKRGACLCCVQINSIDGAGGAVISAGLLRRLDTRLYTSCIAGREAASGGPTSCGGGDCLLTTCLWHQGKPAAAREWDMAALVEATHRRTPAKVCMRCSAKRSAPWCRLWLHRPWLPAAPRPPAARLVSVQWRARRLAAGGCEGGRRDDALRGAGGILKRVSLQGYQSTLCSSDRGGAFSMCKIGSKLRLACATQVASWAAAAMTGGACTGNCSRLWMDSMVSVHTGGANMTDYAAEGARVGAFLSLMSLYAATGPPLEELAQRLVGTV